MAEAVEGIYISGAVVAGEVLNPAAHLVCGLVGECDAENVPGQDSKLVYKICKTPGERAGFPGACAGYNADKALRSGNGELLGLIQIIEHTFHNISVYNDN